jgi:hypothetical protein
MNTRAYSLTGGGVCVMEEFRLHRLRRSERPEMLSAYYGVPVCMIMRANSIKNPDDLASLRELKIPKRSYCNMCSCGECPDSREL